MPAVKGKTPVTRGYRDGRRDEGLGSSYILENTRNLTRPQYFLRLSRIVAAVVATLKSGAPQ